MMAQRDRNKRQGVSVNKSDWKKGTIRLLPCLGKEVGRSTGETKKDSIAALLKKSMM